MTNYIKQVVLPDNTTALIKDEEARTAIAGKQATITGAATTVTSSDLTASKALVSNASGKIDVSAVTSTELGYLSGVTSAIQTQISAKATAATSIAGYGITDAYTKTEIDNMIGDIETLLSQV